MFPNNTDFSPNFTPTGASNNPCHPHNESMPTSASLYKASAEQSTFYSCTYMQSPFSQEYASDTAEQTLPSPFQTISHYLPSCAQTVNRARFLRQHDRPVAIRKHRFTTQGSPLSFPAPPINYMRVPSSTSMELSHGGTNLVSLNNLMYAMDDHRFLNYVVQDQDKHGFSGTSQVLNDVQQLRTSIPGKKRSSVGAVDIEYGFSDANMKFNNKQHPRCLSLTSYSMPVRTSNVKAYSGPAAQGQIVIQSSTGKASGSTNTEVKRHSMYSLSVSVDGTRWDCNGCEYTTEREQDMIRHCSTLRHGGRRFFPCPSCGKVFSRKDSVARHSNKTRCGLRRASLSGSSA